MRTVKLKNKESGKKVTCFFKKSNDGIITLIFPSTIKNGNYEFVDAVKKLLKNEG